MTGLERNELRDWLRLIRSQNVGPITFRQLIAGCGSVAAAIERAPEIARRGGRKLRMADPRTVDKELEAADGIGASFVSLADPDYPAPLAAIDDAPPLLCVLGARSAAATNAVAIVGARNASVAGARIAAEFSRAIGQAGFVVVSGLARGIDTAAHNGAVATGTVAVLAGGIDRIYPPENEPLAERIVAEGGALLSEMPLGWQARGTDFPRRNRIISGLSLAVVVVEAARRSGSLITARRAAQQGRPVYAVPGSPLDPRAAGANLLIREGAILAASAEDILTDIAPMAAREPDALAPLPAEPSTSPAVDDADDTARRIITEALGPSPVEIDDIIRVTGIGPAVVQLVLMELSLAGRLQRHAGHRVSLLT